MTTDKERLADMAKLRAERVEDIRAGFLDGMSLLELHKEVLSIGADIAFYKKEAEQSESNSADRETAGIAWEQCCHWREYARHRIGKLERAGEGASWPSSMEKTRQQRSEEVERIMKAPRTLDRPLSDAEHGFIGYVKMGIPFGEAMAWMCRIEKKETQLEMFEDGTSVWLLCGQLLRQPTDSILDVSETQKHLTRIGLPSIVTAVPAKDGWEVVYQDDTNGRYSDVEDAVAAAFETAGKLRDSGVHFGIDVVEAYQKE